MYRDILIFFSNKEEDIRCGERRKGRTVDA